jgi:cytochrome c oxidase cbb3-type subunit IV
MDLNDIRVVITLASFATFLGVVWWAYSARRRSGFDRAAQSILEEDDDAQDRVRGDGR